MLMPVVYDRPRVEDRTTNKYKARRHCRKCGDESIVLVQQYNFPRLVNHTHPGFEFAELDAESKCLWCYL